MRLFKYYVDVYTYIDRNGKLRPVALVWKHRTYHISRIISTRETFSEAGGCGIKYVCAFGSITRNLFWERDRWFLESSVYEPELIDS